MALPSAPAHPGMTFTEALLLARQGQTIFRPEWQPEAVWATLHDGRLQLHKMDGWHDWIVSDGDMDGLDWITAGAPPEWMLNPSRPAPVGPPPLE